MKRIAWLINPVRAEWESLIGHPFPRDMAAGRLPLESFLYYLVQDTFYLDYFLRVLGLLVAKAAGSQLRHFAIELLSGTVKGEVAMHQAIEREYILPAERPVGTIALAYGDFLVHHAYQGDDFDIMVALAPCVVSYREIATSLNEAPAGALPSVYRWWLDSYQGEEYGVLVDRFVSFLETMSIGRIRDRQERAVWLFRKSCEFEKLFWDDSLSHRVLYAVRDRSLNGEGSI